MVVWPENIAHCDYKICAQFIILFNFPFVCGHKKIITSSTLLVFPLLLTRISMKILSHSKLIAIPPLLTLTLYKNNDQIFAPKFAFRFVG